MSQHLNHLLTSGIAHNLTLARSQAATTPDMKRIVDEVVELTEAAEKQIVRSSDADFEAMRQAMTLVYTGREAVKKAVAG